MFISVVRKTADEKLRRIGKAQQPATTLQTQNFTFVRHNSQSKQHHPYQLQDQHQPQQQQEKDTQLDSLHQHQEQTAPQVSIDKSKQEQHPGRRLSEQEIIQHQIEQELKRNLWKEEQHQQLPRQQKQEKREEIYDNLFRVTNDYRRASLPTAAENGAGEADQGQGDVSFMAERAIASKQGRRDRNGLDNLERSEVKRRSRSEGPAKGRVRHSMDERGGRAGRKQTFDGGGGRVRGFCMDDGDSESSGDLSDPGGMYQRGGRGLPRADSDSDSDRQRWNKNPLMLRRFKKSDKHTRHRLSGGSGLTSGGGAADSGSGAGSLYGNEDAAASSGGGGGGGGSGSGGRSKYQRLEEMRKKRINMAATSDEEGAATPAVRISRLRQRALQSGLGGSGSGAPARPASSLTPSSSAGGNRNFMGGSVGSKNIDKSPKPMANFEPYQREISNTSTSSSSQQHLPWTGFSQPRQFPTEYQVQSKVTPPFSPLNLDSSAAPASKRSHYGTRTPPARPPPPKIQGGVAPKVGKSAFFTIPDSNNSQTNRTLYTSSPDMASQRLNNQSRIPSADFILNSPSQQRAGSKNIYGNIAGRSSGVNTGQSYIQSGSGQHIPSRHPTQFSEVVEMRFQATPKNSSQERPKSQTKIPKKGIIQKFGLAEDYEDSLDELIESNIQYLDTEIEKANKAAKRASGTGARKTSFISHPRNTSLESSSPSSKQNQYQEMQQYKQEQLRQQTNYPHSYKPQAHQPAIQVQSNTSIQLHVSLPADVKDSEPPRIQIAPPNDYHLKPYTLHGDTMSSSVTTKLDHMQPDVVPRKYSYDSSGLRLQRPASEYQYFGDRDDLSKSDSQLNTYIPRQLGASAEAGPGTVTGGGSLTTNRTLQFSSPTYQGRGCVSDINLSLESRKITDSAVASGSNGNLLQVLQVDKGMFSDVEYDIEVSERVKKWETFMKDRDSVADKKTTTGSLNLAPIQENTEASTEPLMLPSAVRRSVMLSKVSSSQLPSSNNSISAYPSSIVPTPPGSAFSYSTTEVTAYTPPTRHRPFSSDTSINKIGENKSFSLDPGSTQRFFHAIQDPLNSGNRLGSLGPQNTSMFGAQSTSSLLQQQGPLRIKTSYSGNDDRSLGSAYELRNQMLPGHQPLALTAGDPVHALHQTPQVATAAPLQITSISSTSTPPFQHGGGSSSNTPIVVRRRKPSRDNAVDPRDPTKRGSRYQEEIEEINNVRTDSVVNLRKRFDADSATMTSEDDQKSVVSTASAKLVRPGRTSGANSGRVSGYRSGAESSSNDLNLMIPGYEKKIRDSDVWSPNLESTQGVPVSIERVTARTLQTIPFSEDPFWKELEEMTSFDPKSMAGHLSLGASQDGGPTPTEPFSDIKSHQHLEVAPGRTPHSSTLPAASSLTHSRNSALSSKERLHRSKSLYTPNFTPLSIEVDKTPSNAVSALDEVLDDINRSSMERKQLSPKKSPSKTLGFLGSGYLKPKQDVPQTTFKFEDGKFKFMKQPPAVEHGKKFDTGSLAQMRAEQTLLPQKQPLQFYQLQRQEQQQQPFKLQPPPLEQKANRQSQAFSNVNNYQLDPNLLKEKLLNTGLVVETDTEDNVHASDSVPSKRLPPLLFTQTPFTLTNPPVSHVNPISTKFVSNIPIGSNTNSNSTRTVSMYGSSSNPPMGSRRFSGEEFHQTNPFQNVKVGPSALDDIQRALAPFSNTSSSYQPGPESLYGTARLESFADESGLNTSSGPNTQPTSWTYQPTKREAFLSSSGGMPGGNSEDAASSSSRLQQVNASMDDLKDLAQNVERRINVIKTRLQSADEGSLDTILSSLKNLQPETDVRRGGDAAAAAAGHAESSSTFEDYYTSKKTKLSKALTELDRIYKSLDLNSDDMTGLPDKLQPQHNYKLYRPTKSSDFILAPQPKSIHLRPMQTRVSSVYIPGLEKQKTNTDLQSVDKETESEFDVISKSFQAIVDEVNQTTNLLSKANENATEPSPPESKDPETSKKIVQITLKPDNFEMSKPVPASDLTAELETSSSETKKEAPRIAPKPQDVNPTMSKDITTVFRPQISTKEHRAKEDILPEPRAGVTASSTAIGSAEQIKTSTCGSSTCSQSQVSDNIVSTTTTASVKSPPASRQRTRPVRDNKIIQEDKKASALRRDGGTTSEKVLGMPPSPGPSPKVGRKIIYNNASELENKIIKPPEMFQDNPPKATEVSNKVDESDTTAVKKLEKHEDEVIKSTNTSSTPLVQSSITKKPDGSKKISQFEVKQNVSSSASPSTVRKIPPPTASRPSQKVPEAVVTSPKSAIRSYQTSNTGTSVVQHRQTTVSSGAEKKREITGSKLGNVEPKHTGDISSDQSPTSPGNKPPLHPWKRTPSDSEKPHGVDTTCTSTISGIPVAQSPSASPKTSSKIPRPLGSEASTVQQGALDKTGYPGGNKTPEKFKSPPSPSTNVTRRVRPSDRKLQTGVSTTEGDPSRRPHSFHELERSTARGGSSRADRDRKCMSSADDGAGEEISPVAQAPVFRSEPVLSDGSVVSQIMLNLRGGKGQYNVNPGPS
ncbi:hypothetical protein ElyMa_001167100 [Elysia marginata]|uniref:HP domain-containing protein n=1 Tax=Elysia marginata TaxID=1093978 RepID=A0AAV4I253_9GAST|nr:hypothetical protein ElyMa_001167100 [Elysia marginata]